MNLVDSGGSGNSITLSQLEGSSGGGGVGVEHEGGCDGLWECVQGASVVLLEDLPGLDVGVDLLDYVPDPVDAAADLLGGVGELLPAGFLGGVIIPRPM